MARTDLKRRVDKLEAQSGYGETIWLRLNPDETEAQRLARYEAEKGKPASEQVSFIQRVFVGCGARPPAQK